MSKIIRPGQAILFMKVGTHAQETLEDIIARKSKEIEEAGYAMWGYGGNTCHPATMVQPFAKRQEAKGAPIYLCMQEVDSKHFAEPVRADECSVDGQTWELIPDEINVLGSRFALLIEELRQEDLTLPLTQTQVAIGNSMGRRGDRYIRGRVDKACLELVGDEHETQEQGNKILDIGLIAKLRAPYAVFLRNHPKNT